MRSSLSSSSLVEFGVGASVLAGRSTRQGGKGIRDQG